MASKVQCELTAKVQGFVEGMNQASESAKQYETDTRRVKDSLGNFRKEFSQAKKDVMNLASAYSKLDATAKASQFGKEMAAQLEAAKQKASEMLDMQSDLNQELKNMASDTRVFDTLSEGMGVFMTTTASALGVIAQFTGNEEDARKAVVAFTTAQSVLQAATKIQNALQKQSNLMLAIGAVQNKAAAAAATLKAAAEGKGAVATKASTVAQAAFNAVAKANPYVLLATAILGVAAALGTYMYASKKATAEAKAAAEAAKKHKEWQETLNTALGDSLPTFMRLQAEWKTLRSEAEKTQWIEKNKSEFEKLGVAVNNVSDAENVLVTNSHAVVNAMLLRAEAAAKAAYMQKQYEKMLEAQAKLEGTKGRKLEADEVQDLIDSGVNPKYIKQTGGWNRFNREYEVDVERATRNMMMTWTLNAEKLSEESAKAQQKAHDILAEKGIEAAGKTGAKLAKANKEAAKKAAEGSVAYAELMVQQWNNRLKEADVSNPEVIKKIKAEIDKWQKELNRRKLMVGLDVIEKDKAKTQAEILSEYEKQLKTAEAEAAAALILAQLHQKDANEIAKLTEEWEKATKARKDYEATKKAVTEEKPTATGSSSYSDVMQGKYEHTEDDLTKAMNTLKEEAKKIDASTEEGHEKLEKIKEKYTEIADEQEKVVKGNEEIASSSEKASRKARKLADKYDMIGDAVASIGDSFASLSELAEDDPALNVAGIVAEAVANMFAGMARASAQAWELGPWGWAAFSAAALAQTLAMVAQIKSAAQFTEGGISGIVGGSSYHNDKIWARVNSGEMILNKRQQKNLFNLLDQDVMPQKGGANVTVTGVIRGTDIMLVQKNTNKVRRNAGTQITF